MNPADFLAAEFCTLSRSSGNFVRWIDEVAKNVLARMALQLAPQTTFQMLADAADAVSERFDPERYLSRAQLLNRVSQLVRMPRTSSMRIH